MSDIAPLGSELLLRLKEPILATSAYFILYYSWLLVMLVCRWWWIDREIWRKLKEERKDSKEKPSFLDHRHALEKHPIKYILDRSQLNQLEQMPPFLLGLWLYALFINPARAGFLGLVYTGLRVLYPFLYRTPRFLLPLVTFPNYGIVAFFLFSVLFKAVGFTH